MFPDEENAYFGEFLLKYKEKYGKLIIGFYPKNGRRLSPLKELGGDFSLLQNTEEVMSMVTYSELFQFCLVIIGMIALFFQAKKK